MDSMTNLPARRPRKRERDERVRRLARMIRREAPGGRLDDPMFRPVLQSFCEISILKGLAFAELRNKPLLDDRGELRTSIETFRKLAEAQMRIARELGLTPAAARLMGQANDTRDVLGSLAENHDPASPDAE
jgi:hypothetical protein